MGADFLHITFPRFTMNDGRKELIRKAVCELTVEDWTDFTSELFEENYSVEKLLNDIELACSVATKDADTLLCHEKNSGKAYRANITGGFAWGDHSTSTLDTYSLFSRASFFDSIYNLALQFAVEDCDCEIYESIRKRRLTMISSKQVTIVTVTDPDTHLPVEVEIHKLENGAMVGLDGAFLEQSDSDPFSPYDPDVSFKA